MLHDEPSMRYSLADISAHPWVQLQQASQIEIKQEFTARLLEMMINDNQTTIMMSENAQAR
jgi:hypothetical protein